MLHKKYRPNVAAIIMSPDYPNTCEVFIAERIDIEGAWQFPQGGIDEGETPLEALYRELLEEIGTNEIEILAQYPRWIAYDFPSNMEHKFYSFDGQKQRYFLVRLKHANNIDLNKHTPEFRAYQFIHLKDLLKKIVPFKRQVYRQVIAYFKREGIYRVLIVQKYGGTSMGSIERIHNVAQRVLESVKLGHQVVVVVSAMSGETDRLLEFGKNFSHNPNKREMDRIVSAGEWISSAALSMALERYGHRAISLSGKEAGILTSSHFQNAVIQSIDTQRITELLEKNYIVVIAGFQGADIQGETTTLGRGGSDLSAVALAGALKAHLCEIYTDVDGVYTTDPRIEEKAQKIAQISYDEMLELASMGAKVLLNRSVELAKKLSVKLVTRNSFNHSEGTLIVAEKDFKGERMETPIVSGIALDKNQARVSMEGVEDRPGIAAEIFGALAEYRINVDMIVQTIGRDGKTDLDFTIVKTQIEETKQALKPFLAQMDSIDYDENIAKVSIVGVGMKSHSGVASIAFKALAKDNINIMMISTSEIKISVLIDIKYAELAVRTLHAVYQLDQ